MDEKVKEQILAIRDTGLTNKPVHLILSGETRRGPARGTVLLLTAVAGHSLFRIPRAVLDFSPGGRSEQESNPSNQRGENHAQHPHRGPGPQRSVHSDPDHQQQPEPHPGVCRTYRLPDAEKYVLSRRTGNSVRFLFVSLSGLPRPHPGRKGSQDPSRSTHFQIDPPFLSYSTR